MATQTLSATGPGSPVPVANVPQAVLAAISVGASLTYTIEVTGDAQTTTSTGSAVWFPLDPAAVALTGSGNWTISAPVTFVRPNITSYTSGTLSFSSPTGVR